MAKLILALDRQSWEIAPPDPELAEWDSYDPTDLHTKIDEYMHSGVDGIKITAAALFNGVYKSIEGKYRNFKHQHRWGEYYGSEPPFPDIDIFLDLKIADISFGDNQGTNFKIVQSLARNKNPITHVNVHGFMGRNAIKECVAAAGDEIDVLVLCGMTDPNYELFVKAPDTNMLCSWSEGEGASGVILPANDLYIVKRVKGLFPNLPIWSPGFGRQVNYDKLPHSADIYDHLKEWRSIVGDNPENAAIVGTHLLDHPNLEEEVEKIKEILK